MILAGLQKTSLIDYPGCISSVVFLTGCNLTCPFCHNPELARGEYPQRLSVSDLIAFLEPRRELIDGIVISGGEPTLAPGLDALCSRAHRLGLKVKLDTNGSRPEVLEQLFAHGCIDYVAMDLKAPVEEYAPHLARHDMAAPLRQSIRLIMEAAPDYEFRTTCVRPFVDRLNILRMAGAIAGARCYVLQPFRPGATLQPDFFGSADPACPPEEIEALRALAADAVQVCRIRTGA